MGDKDQLGRDAAKSLIPWSLIFSPIFSPVHNNNCDFISIRRLSFDQGRSLINLVSFKLIISPRYNVLHTIHHGAIEMVID